MGLRGLHTPESSPDRPALFPLSFDVLETRPNLIDRRRNHQQRYRNGDQAQRAERAVQHRLQDHEQNAHGAQRPDGEAENNHDPGHASPSVLAAYGARYRISQVAKHSERGIRDRQDIRHAGVEDRLAPITEERLPNCANQVPLVSREIGGDREATQREPDNRQALTPGRWVICPAWGNVLVARRRHSPTSPSTIRWSERLSWPLEDG